jgi:hypothetical protein
MVRHEEKFLFVEGGGDHNPTLASECRRAFRTLLDRAGLQGRMPRVVACGGRRNAYERFCTALHDQADGDVAILLVDSEAPVTATSPWEHVKHRQGDGWDRPAGASDEQLHFMVQCMESWFFADPATLKAYFGEGFSESALPARARALEDLPKDSVLTALEHASQHSRPKGRYRKGRDSFAILERSDPARVRQDAGFWARRFFEYLAKAL